MPKTHFRHSLLILVLAGDHEQISEHKQVELGLVWLNSTVPTVLFEY